MHFTVTFGKRCSVLIKVKYRLSSPLFFVAMDSERQKRKEEIEKALGFIQYVILSLSCYLLYARGYRLFNDLILWFYRSSLPFPDPEGYEVSVPSYFSV